MSANTILLTVDTGYKEGVTTMCLHVCGAVYPTDDGEKFKLSHPVGVLPYVADDDNIDNLFRACMHHAHCYALSDDLAKATLESRGQSNLPAPDIVELPPETVAELKEVLDRDMLVEI